MGWASATQHVLAIIKSAQKNVPDDKARGALYRDTIRTFQDGDWDTQDEAQGIDPAFDKALRTVNRRR